VIVTVFGRLQQAASRLLAVGSGSSLRRVRRDVVLAPELAIALLLAATLWFPDVSGGMTWKAAFILLVLVAGYRMVKERRWRIVPVTLVAYIAVYVPAALRATRVTSPELFTFFGRPLLALAVAAAVTTARQRRRVLVLVVLFAASEIPVTAGQAISYVATHSGSLSPDGVVGTLGVSQGPVVALVAMAAAVIVLAGWLAGVLSLVRAAILVVLLLAVGVFTGTRAVVPFVVVVGVAMAIGAATLLRGRHGSRRSAGLVGASIAAAALLYGGFQVLYPEAFVGALASQELPVLGAGAGPELPLAPAVPLHCGPHRSAQNRFSNGDFHLGLAGWSPARGARLVVERLHGSPQPVLRIVADGSQGNQSAFTSLISVCPGHVYTASAWFRAPAGARVGLALYNKQELATVARATGRWQRLSVSLLAVDGSMFVEAYPAGTTKTAIHIKQVRLVRQPSVAAACRVSGSTNLLVDGGYKHGTGNWRSYRGATLSTDSSRAKVGGWSLRLTSDTRYANESAATTVNGLCLGDGYTASAWVWAPRGTTVAIAVSAGAPETSQLFAGTGAWRRVEVSARNFGDPALIEIYPSGTIATTIWIDDVRLERHVPSTSVTAVFVPVVPIRSNLVSLRRQRNPALSPSRLPVTSLRSIAAGAQAPFHGVQLLPGRLRQLQIALHLSFHSGFLSGVVGRGLGAADLDPSYTYSGEVPAPQKTGGTWPGRLLIETGWLGLTAFVALLLWLAALGLQLWRNGVAAADRALGAALPGLAALTVLGGVELLILDVRGYSIVFWILVGLAISAARAARPVPE